MELDDRSKVLLQEVCILPNVKTKDLCIKYKLTRGQVDYSFKKINGWLKDRKLQPIKKDSYGYYVSDSMHKKLFIRIENLGNSSEQIFSSEERALILCYMLLSKKEILTLNHLIFELKVSKNTILADLNFARNIVKNIN